MGLLPEGRVRGGGVCAQLGGGQSPAWPGIRASCEKIKTLSPNLQFPSPSFGVTGFIGNLPWEGNPLLRELQSLRANSLCMIIYVGRNIEMVTFLRDTETEEEWRKMVNLFLYTSSLSLSIY